jgi:hypothetical protein
MIKVANKKLDKFTKEDSSIVLAYFQMLTFVSPDYSEFRHQISFIWSFTCDHK